MNLNEKAPKNTLAKIHLKKIRLPKGPFAENLCGIQVPRSSSEFGQFSNLIAIMVEDGVSYLCVYIYVYMHIISIMYTA